MKRRRSPLVETAHWHSKWLVQSLLDGIDDRAPVPLGCCLMVTKFPANRDSTELWQHILGIDIEEWGKA